MAWLWEDQNRHGIITDDCIDIIGAGTETVLIKYLQNFCSRIGLKPTEIVMHMLRIRDSTLQGKSNGLCIHWARCRVDNDSVNNNISTAYVASICFFEVKLDRREEFENRQVVVVSIHVGIFWYEPVLEGVQVKWITCW